MRFLPTFPQRAPARELRWTAASQSLGRGRMSFPDLLTEWSQCPVTVKGVPLTIRVDTFAPYFSPNRRKQTVAVFHGVNLRLVQTSCRDAVLSLWSKMIEHEKVHRRATVVNQIPLKTKKAQPKQTKPPNPQQNPQHQVRKHSPRAYHIRTSMQRVFRGWCLPLSANATKR